MTTSAIEVRALPLQHTAVVRHRISMQQTERIPEWIEQTFVAVQSQGQEPTGVPFLRTFSMSAGEMDIEVGWPVAQPFTGDGEVSASSLPAGPAAVGTYFGPYEQISSVYEAVGAWCQEQGRTIAGPPWESYLTDPNEEPDPAKWRTDIHFPLEA